MIRIKNLFSPLSITFLLVLFLLAACGAQPTASASPPDTINPTAKTAATPVTTQTTTANITITPQPTSSVPTPVPTRPVNNNPVVSSAPPPAAAQNCGTVLAMPNASISVAQEQQAVQCFWQSYQKCSNAKLTFNVNVGPGTTHIFSTSKQNSGCVIMDGMNNAVCSNMSFGNNTLRITGCNKEGDIAIGLQSVTN